ncbi:hypothetical protein NQZ68_008639 [Dissostichus eleginoides]|nr:hypothetical protein NQZ68_008639 [Dissostichus eleginoides]
MSQQIYSHSLPWYLASTAGCGSAALRVHSVLLQPCPSIQIHHLIMFPLSLGLTLNPLRGQACPQPLRRRLCSLVVPICPLKNVSIRSRLLSKTPKRRRSSVNLGALASPQPVPPKPQTLVRFLAPAKLCANSLTLPLQALIESGAVDSFLGRELATQLGLTLEPLEGPITAFALNGREISKCRGCAVPSSRGPAVGGVHTGGRHRAEGEDLRSLQGEHPLCAITETQPVKQQVNKY